MLLKLTVCLPTWGQARLCAFVGLVTIFVAGLSSTLEFDFKKLVALSTLRQIGLLF